MTHSGKRFCILFVVLSFGFSQAFGADTPPTLIRGGKVFDGKIIIDTADVIVRGGKVERVGKSNDAPPGAITVDATGCTLLPGLIDCHTHVISDAMLEQALVFGVTTE